MLIELAERRLAPDAAIRAGIRRLLAQRLRRERALAAASDEERIAAMRRQFAAGPIAEAADDALRQHYEAPTELFLAMLGPRLKYSCCLWEQADATLAESEEAMLALTAQRADLADGQRILDLGCGWGSFALWAAERFPQSAIVAVSHSRTQHEYVAQESRRRGLRNVQHVIANAGGKEFRRTMAEVALPTNGDRNRRTFDRIVSVEMFEHMHNVERLLHELGELLAPDGRLFVHVFCHRRLFYRYRDAGRDDWMARHFFTGGAMPPLDLFEHVQGPFRLDERWEIDGRHYARTLRAWLAQLDNRRDGVLQRFEHDLPRQAARRQLQRWRMFLMACEELFAHREGQWLVSHHLLALQ